MRDDILRINFYCNKGMAPSIKQTENVYVYKYKRSHQENKDIVTIQQTFEHM